MRLIKYILTPYSNKAYVFKLQAPIAFLFAKILKLDLNVMAQVKIYQRSTMRYVPFYAARNGGGAITLGSDTWQSITFTENFFTDNNSIYDGKAYGNRPRRFMDLLSHEVGHIVHARRYRYLWYYLLRFAYEYIRYGHALSHLEAEAESYRLRYHSFLNFVVKHYEVNLLERVICSDELTDERKMIIIDQYWSSFEKHNVV